MELSTTLINVPPLTREDLNHRIREAIVNSRSLRVVKEDVLGEGEGAWDSDPRYPVDVVNCMTWLQLVLCEAYGHGLEDKLPVMDRIRYYGGHVAYGLRKHFIDHWLAIEPAPLRRIPLGEFPGFQRSSVELNFEHFKAFHEYSCDLYREDLSKIDIEYITPEGFVALVETLRPGHYVVFAVPTEKYLSRFGQGCGPMGLVHSIVLAVNSTDEAGNPSLCRSQDAVIYHASIRLGAVANIKLVDYLENMRVVYHGYALFEIDPAWDFMSPCADDEAVRKIKKCELTLGTNPDCRRL